MVSSSLKYTYLYFRIIEKSIMIKVSAYLLLTQDEYKSSQLGPEKLFSVTDQRNLIFLLSLLFPINSGTITTNKEERRVTVRISIAKVREA